MIVRAAKTYSKWLNRWPLPVSLVTGFCLSSTADVIAQNVEHDKQYDPWRSLRMGTYAVIAWVPVGFFWFRAAERMFPGTGLVNMAKKLSIDQLIICPSLLLWFLSSNELMQGKGVQAAIDRVKQDFVSTQLKNFMVWTPAQLTNFYLIPQLWRVLFTRTVSFFWSIYLSWRGKFLLTTIISNQILAHQKLNEKSWAAI